MSDITPERLFLRDVKDELGSARRRFPDPEGLLAAMVEEVGEVSTALMEESGNLIYVECVQVAAMAMRIALEGDPAMDGIRFNRGKPPYHGRTE